MISPAFVKIPESWGVLRDTMQPKENYKEDSFGKTFDETYDYDTLFSGVIKIEDNLVVCAPPFLNLKDFIVNNVKITDGKLKFTTVKVQPPLTFKFIQLCLSEIITEEEKVNYIINYIKEKRETKYVEEIKRFYT